MPKEHYFGCWLIQVESYSFENRTKKNHNSITTSLSLTYQKNKVTYFAPTENVDKTGGQPPFYNVSGGHASSPEGTGNFGQDFLYNPLYTIAGIVVNQGQTTGREGGG